MKSFRKSLLLLLVAVWSISGHAKTTRDEVIGNSGWSLWLDRQAEWKQDELYLPPVHLDELQVAPPTAGWERLFHGIMDPKEVSSALEADCPIRVHVPGTVEEYCWDALSAEGGLGLSGDYRGVSWWSTTFSIPRSMKGKRLKLTFTEGVRQRAEVFLNEKLVGYELNNQSPFVLDITDDAEYGKENRLAVRITDPDGNFSWEDKRPYLWGRYQFPMSHGFGGILGEVRLSALEAVHVEDVFVKNKPSLKDIDVDITLRNEGENPENFSVEVSVRENWKHCKAVRHPKTVYSARLGSFSLQPSEERLVPVSVSVPEALLWDIKDANLYDWVTVLKDSRGRVIDEYVQRFGFRFLSVVGHGDSSARFYFNGKRTTLISAISWGYWPVTGIYPTPAMARRHIQSAFDLGMNMLNFHRCRGNHTVLDLADEMGILYYEEPGSLVSHKYKLEEAQDNQLCRMLNFQRLTRMVKDHRNHPSLVIYNMQNECPYPSDEDLKGLIEEAHELDPTRFISYSSGFMQLGPEALNKMHMLPYDPEVYFRGYCDIHNAPLGAGAYLDSYYNSPEDFIRNDKAGGEILIWGEEAALATPPHMEKIVQYKEAAGEKNGWDGADYRHWYEEYSSYLAEKGMEKNFPSVTDLVRSMGNVMYYEHGRLLENARIADESEAYIYNGYEDMKRDNFSGCVDVYRNHKGDPELMAEYARPLYVAVKLHDKTAHEGDTNLFDLYVINENVLPAGEYCVKWSLTTPDDRKIPLGEKNVAVTGGDRFSDLVARDLPLKLDRGAGYYRLHAGLYDLSGKKLADGHDEAFAVNWKDMKLASSGSILSNTPQPYIDFVESLEGDMSCYAPEEEGKDYLFLGNIQKDYGTSPVIRFLAKDKKTEGLEVNFFKGKHFNNWVGSRISTTVMDYNFYDKLIPGYDLLGKQDFSIRWEGYVYSEMDREVTFRLHFNENANVYVDGKKLGSQNRVREGRNRYIIFTIDMKKEELHSIRIENMHVIGNWFFKFDWRLPVDEQQYDMERILSQVADGMELFIVEDHHFWLDLLRSENAITSYRTFYPGISWIGSSFFVKEHPFFDGLPTDCAMNWEYQNMVRYDANRHFGLTGLQNEEAVVGLVASPEQKVSTALGIIPYGKGHIVYSTFNFLKGLEGTSKSSNITKKVFANQIKWCE